ncbi:MAG: SLBB domain-containing protein, partial [Rectinemataceae bacterium]
YDLFRAEREGDLSQDPYLRPGDVVEVKKAERIVRVDGSVYRAGSYQLLAGEGVRELVGYYGGGLTPTAKADSLVLTRKATLERPEGESLLVALDSRDLPQLGDGDSIRVPSREEYLPVVYLEGAVKGEETGVQKEAGASNAEAVVSEQYRMVRVPYRAGQLVSQVVRSMQARLDSRADLKRAFITREGESRPIEVNLEKLLYRYDVKDDVVLRAGDRIVIPYGGMYVFVTGEVKKSSWVGVTGLTRLSDAVRELLTGYSNVRQVEVRSEDGSVGKYDLFRAEREGDLSQDPYLRPGDVVE